MDDPSIQLEIARIKARDDLPTPPFPRQPELGNSTIPMRTKVKLIQAYITSLEYNYTGETFFVKKKDRGFRHVTSTAKLIIRDALPIQCVEAVYLGAFLTAGMSEVERFPLCFRSSLDDRIYRHIVLAVRSGVMWGALGLSRRNALMYKKLKYSSFSELIADFRESYAGNWHHLEHVSVGFPLPHDISSNVPLKWKVMRASVGTDVEWESAARDLDRFVVCAPALFERFVSTGKIPDHALLSGLSEYATKSGEEGGVGPAATGDGNDPRGSPGIGSPGPRSPWALSYRLGPGMRAVRCRRASTPIGKSAAKEGDCIVGGKNTGAGREALESHGLDGGHHASATEICSSMVFVSPPRARARSVWAGFGGRLPGKERRFVVGGETSAESRGMNSTTTSRQRSTEGTEYKLS